MIWFHLPVAVEHRWWSDIQADNLAAEEGGTEPVAGAGVWTGNGRLQHGQVTRAHIENFRS